MDRTPLWTAIITPMKADGSIDFDSFENLLRRQEKAGNGVLILGSTGEGLNLRDREKSEIVNFAVDLNLEVPVMAGAGGFHLSQQIEFVKYCTDVGVDAILLVTPLYAKPGAEGQFEWFSELMAETDIPCMLYNVPSRTGVKMHPSVPARLNKKFDHLLGVKEASGSVDEFKAFRREAPAVDFYSGDDGITPDFAAHGAVGLVSVASNVWPEETHRYLQECLNGSEGEFISLWREAVATLFASPNPIPAKVLLHHKKWIEYKMVRLPLSLADISSEQQQDLLNADQNITDWYNEITTS